MAGPMAGVGMGATLLSGFISAAGDIFQGEAQKKMYGFQSGLAYQRAGVQQFNAGLARVTGETQALESGVRGGQVIGAQKAGQGASNVDVTSGSAANVRRSQLWAQQTQEADIRTNAERRAYGREVQAAQDVSQASAYTAAGEVSKTAGEIGAISSIVGAIGGTASKWQQAKLAGVDTFGQQSDQAIY